MIALGLSLLVNLVIVAVVGLAALESTVLRKKIAQLPPTPAETVATIFAEITPTQTTPEPAPVPQKEFARTSKDQSAPPEKRTDFFGERDTRATSDLTPAPSAPPLPSQKGITPRDEADIETTESAYQDGKIANDPSTAATTNTPPVPLAPATPATPTTAPPMETSATVKPDVPGPDRIRSTPPPREKLMDGPNPVDVQVPREVAAKDEEIKPTPEKRPAPDAPLETKPTESAKTQQLPKPKPTLDPAFKGFQRKTAITGSISRSGRSALDVADSPLGRYQAAISRAVEQEWQRNCVRHRDFITPGFITVRFFVETSGKVRSVQFVGDMETGEVQKGFTLNSIRNAEIPAMPAAVRKEYTKEPLELIFRFFF